MVLSLQRSQQVFFSTSSILLVWAGLAPNPLIAADVKIGSYLFHFITYLEHK